MKKLILFLFVILLLQSCVKFDKLGMPSWEAEYQVNVLNDTYTVNQIADEESLLYVQNDVLRFKNTIADSVSYSNVHIDHPMEKSVTISLGNLSDEISQLNGQTTVVPTFNIEPLQEDIPNYNEFEEITFNTAQIKFTIDNNTDIYLGNYPENPLMLSLLNKESGAMVYQYIVEQNIPPHSSLTSVLDLSGYTFPNSLKLQLEGGSIGSNGETITIDTSQNLGITIALLDFSIRHVRAHIPYQELPEQTITQYLSITFPHIDGTFSLTSQSSINFVINSSLPGETSMKLISVGQNGEKDTLKVNGEIPVLTITPGETNITFYSDNSNLNELLTLLPERFDMIVNPSVGDTTDTIYDIYSDEQISYRITIDTDINIDADCWIIPRSDDKPNITATDVSQLNDTNVDNFISGGFKMKFDNQTGIQLGMDILVSGNRENLDDFDKVLNPDTTQVTLFSIPVIKTGKDSIDFVIKRRDLDVFIPDSVYAVPRIKLISAADSPLANGINVKAKLYIKLLVNKDILSSSNNNMKKIVTSGEIR